MKWVVDINGIQEWREGLMWCMFERIDRYGGLVIPDPRVLVVVLLVKCFKAKLLAVDIRTRYAIRQAAGIGAEGRISVSPIRVSSVPKS